LFRKFTSSVTVSYFNCKQTFIDIPQLSVYLTTGSAQSACFIMSSSTIPAQLSGLSKL